MAFYKFLQNNSGGGMILSENIKPLIFIEACNARKANILARQLGIYFNGVRCGLDCPCCGNRWEKAEDGDWSQCDEEAMNEYIGLYTWLERYDPDYYRIYRKGSIPLPEKAGN